MSIRKLSLCLFLVCVAASGLAVSQQPAKPPVDSAAVGLARRLLQAMHYGENMIAGIESILTEQRRENAQMPAAFYDSLLARIKRTVPEALDSLAPLYARRFTATELDAMTRFYESPTGQKLATQQAVLSSEAMQFGQRWGARTAAAVIKDLVDAGVDITKP
jgi:hypothetical protein